MCRYCDAANAGKHGLQQAAPQKRQGTKSREVGQRRCRHGYPDCLTSTLAGHSQSLLPARTPGGSSGGIGAAVAANLALAGTGSDTVNSIRSSNALVGIRPTVAWRTAMVRAIDRKPAWPPCATVSVMHRRIKLRSTRSPRWRNWGLERSVRAHAKGEARAQQ